MGETSETTLLTTPEHQASLGINATVVYGEAVTGVVGASTSLVLGCNSSFCINPVTLVHRGANFPKVFKAFAMGSAGGNLGFTLGTKADIVMGPRYEVNWGGKVELNIGNAIFDSANKNPGDDEMKKTAGATYLWDTSAKKVNDVFGGLISGLVITFFLTYGLDTDQNRRAQYLVSVQLLLNVLVTVLVSIDSIFKDGNTTFSKSVDELLKAEAGKEYKVTKKMVAEGVVSSLANAVVPFVLPPIAWATAEGHFGTTSK